MGSWLHATSLICGGNGANEAGRDKGGAREALGTRAEPDTRIRRTPNGALEKLAIYLHFVSGQGAGTGWDEGEYIVAAEALRGIASPTVVDCGANFGHWTTGVRSLIGHEAGRWVLIEPTAELLAGLRALPNVDVIDAAAGEVEEVRDFYVPTGPSGWMTLHQRGDSFSQGREFQKRQVRVVRIDAQLEQREIERVDYMKMDVEGHEIFALRGLGRYIEERRILAFSFEFGSANVNSRTFFRDFWEMLDPLGYEISRIAPGGVRVPIRSYYETLEFFRGATNYLATARA